MEYKQLIEQITNVFIDNNKIKEGRIIIKFMNGAESELIIKKTNDRKE